MMVTAGVGLMAIAIVLIVRRELKNKFVTKLNIGFSLAVHYIVVGG